MKYKLKLDYTADELKELKELSERHKSPMAAITKIVRSNQEDTKEFLSLGSKYVSLAVEEEFDFMADINNTIMGTVIFPGKKYWVQDIITDECISWDNINDNYAWGYSPLSKTKQEWLAINPAYESMLVEVEE